MQSLELAQMLQVRAQEPVSMSSPNDALHVTVTDVLFNNAHMLHTLVSLQTRLTPLLTVPELQVLPPVRQKFKAPALFLLLYLPCLDPGKA